MSATSRNDRAFDALADADRRQLLCALLDANPHDSLDPFDLLAEDRTPDESATTRLELTHTHLPKLADMGFIDWDRESGTFSQGRNWTEIAPLLRLIRDHQDELNGDLLHT
jgi:hypothetical protein